MSTARPFLTALAMLCAVALTSSAVAGPKDIDGKRTRARRTAVGAAVQDNLGPGDAADWRYVRVEGTGDLTITVSFEPGTAKAELTVTDAKGNIISKAKPAKAGTRSITIAVSPGIYYIEVSSPEKTSYTLDTKLV